MSRGLFLAVAAVLIAVAPPLEAHDVRHDHDAVVGSSFSQAMARAMDRMHADMTAAVPSGTPAIDFLRMMIPHHQGAVDMAVLLLLHTEDPKLRNLAQSIITEQRYEIQLMERMLSQAVTERKQ